MDNYGTVDNPAWITTVFCALMWGRGVSGRTYGLDLETRGGGASDACDVAALPGGAGILSGQ